MDLLSQLLHLVGSGGLQSSRDLAAKLGTSVELVDSMFDELVRAGYLQEVQAGCGQSCRSCTASATCKLGVGARIWTLTARGRRLAGGQSN